jgi:hypothetical protein
MATCLPHPPRARLAPLGVWQVLGRLANVKALQDCVRSALAPTASRKVAGDRPAAAQPKIREDAAARED